MQSDLKSIMVELVDDYRSDDFARLMRKLPGMYDTLSVEEMAQLMNQVDAAQADKIARRFAKEEIARSE